MTLLWVMTGSALGAVTRLWLVNQVQRALPVQFPWGTLVVNVSGAVLIGVLAGNLPAQAGAPGSPLRAALMIGMLGSYTTVSSFSVQTLALWQARRRRLAVANVLASLTLCLAGAALGLALTAVWS